MGPIRAQFSLPSTPLASWTRRNLRKSDRASGIGPIPRSKMAILGSSQNLFQILRFRNGPFSVKSLVSTSSISGAPRERAVRCAVASAALAMCFRCRRRRFLASVRGRRKAATPCHQGKQRAYLMTRGPTNVCHLRRNGFTGSVVSATGLRAERICIKRRHPRSISYTVGVCGNQFEFFLGEHQAV
jgi:hypothetical protein